MAKIHSMMDVGKRSLQNSQTALQTVGHNIANKSTEGYSRQRVEIKANVPVDSGQVRIGMGARTGAVTRINNPYLEKQITSEGNQLGYHESRAGALGRVEQIYNEQVNKGLNKSMGEFFNAYREFSSSPENMATRTLVRDTSFHLTQDFARVSKNLKTIQNDLDQQIKANIEKVNEYTREVANLNEKIVQIEVAGATANDERDRRELLVKKIGEIINIKAVEGDKGGISIRAGNSSFLVSSTEATKLMVAPTDTNSARGEVHLGIFFQPSASTDPMNITQEITGGNIGGMLNVRNETIVNALDDVDFLAHSFADSVNEIHRKGFDLRGKPGGDFFEIGGTLNAAQDLALNVEIAKDPAKIVAAAMPGGAGDNRIANEMSQLQFQKLLDDGTSTFDEYYNALVGKIGVAADRANSKFESQKNMVSQLNNLRDSISGVSLDEEATKMIEFQKSFDASARLIRVADEMFDTILSMKRM
ncbi:MAG: flagellar hook-associated protein FlgK [Proteobacteria bacterium SG_bin7]|nr:MAG: flagellar hook-associated protein FlgK [Proteobacteria bacterium SG_bin7]